MEKKYLVLFTVIGAAIAVYGFVTFRIRSFASNSGTSSNRIIRLWYPAGRALCVTPGTEIPGRVVCPGSIVTVRPGVLERGMVCGYCRGGRGRDFRDAACGISSLGHCHRRAPADPSIP